MSDKEPSTAPRCAICGRLYAEGRRGVCAACHQATRRKARRRPYTPHRKPSLRCQCGQPAVTVLTVKVGRSADGLYTVRLPLCHTCLELERQMWQEQERESGKI